MVTAYIAIPRRFRVPGSGFAGRRNASARAGMKPVPDSLYPQSGVGPGFIPGRLNAEHHPRNQMPEPTNIRTFERLSGLRCHHDHAEAVHPVGHTLEVTVGGFAMKPRGAEQPDHLGERISA